MATSIAVGDVLVSQVVCQAPTEQQAAVLNRYWYCFSSSGGSVTFGQFAGVLDAAWEALYKALMTNSARYNGTRVRRVFPVVPNMAQWETVVANAGIGTAGTSGLPTQVCGLIQLYSNFIGRKGQGRQYVPFADKTASVDPGVPTSGYLTALATLAIQLRSNQTVTVGGATAVFVPILFNPASPSTVIQLVSSDEAPAFATQKRRGQFGKTNKVPF